MRSLLGIVTWMFSCETRYCLQLSSIFYGTSSPKRLGIYRDSANPEEVLRTGLRRDSLPVPPSVLAPESALGLRPRMALSSAQAALDFTSLTKSAQNMVSLITMARIIKMSLRIKAPLMTMLCTQRASMRSAMALSGGQVRRAVSVTMNRQALILAPPPFAILGFL